MKRDGTNQVMPRRQTISECLRERHTANPAHSNGKPDVPSTTTNINVRFAPISMIGFEIQRDMGIANRSQPVGPGLPLAAVRVPTTTMTTKLASGRPWVFLPKSGPAIDLAPSVRADITGGVGIRYWF